MHSFSKSRPIKYEDWKNFFLIGQTFKNESTSLSEKAAFYLFYQQTVTDSSQHLILYKNLPSVLKISMALDRVRTLYCSFSMKIRYISGRITGATFEICESPKSTVYILEQLAPNSCCLLYWTGLNQFIGHLGEIHRTLNSCPARQEVIKCTIAKNWLADILRRSQKFGLSSSFFVRISGVKL